MAWKFSEKVFRMPSFISGLLAIVVWAIFMRNFGFNYSALIFLLIIPIQPWYLRFMTEARGYSMLILFFPILYYLINKCLQKPNWKHWSLFGLMQILLIYTWPGMAINITIINLLLLFSFYIFSKTKPKIWLRTQIIYWVIINIFSVMLLLQLLAPCFLQVYGYLDKTALRLIMDLSWYKNLFGMLAFGTECRDFYANRSEINPAYISLQNIKVFGFNATKIALIFYGLLLLGFLRMLKNQRGRFFITTYILPFLILQTAAISRKESQYLFNWYYFYLTPLVIMLFAIGLTFLIKILLLKSNKISIIIPFLIIGLSIFSYAKVVNPQLKIIRKYPLENIKNAAIFPHKGKVLEYEKYLKKNRRVLTGHIFYPASTYDPFAYFIDDVVGVNDFNPGLMRLMRWADLYDFEFYVLLAAANIVRSTKECPDIMKFLDKKKYFKKVHTAYCINPAFTREVFYYKGGKFDYLKNANLKEIIEMKKKEKIKSQKK